MSPFATRLALLACFLVSCARSGEPAGVASVPAPSLSAVENHARLGTMAGTLSIHRSSDASSYDSLHLDETRIFHAPGQSLEIVRFARFQEYDLALVLIDSLGTGTIPKYAWIVLRDAKQKPVIVRDAKFFSADGTLRWMETQGGIEVDLGWEGGKRKKALFRPADGKLSFSMNGGPPSLGAADCSEAYRLLQLCAAEGPSPSCDSDLMDSIGGMAFARSLNALGQNPAFSRKRFGELCAEACERPKSAPKRQQFGARFCGKT